jgi:hypothetical protein
VRLARSSRATRPIHRAGMVRRHRRVEERRRVLLRVSPRERYGRTRG